VRQCARGGNMKAATIAWALLATLATGSAACATRVQATAPWLDQLIARFQAEAVANPPRRILRYRYRGQTVYYVPPSCCDQPGILYDETGTQVCAPDGGISGRGDGRCPDFHEQRSAESLIWSDSRSR
ncbi:DUF6970 domain-containing protein, partial [Dokdonella sp.]